MGLKGLFNPATFNPATFLTTVVIAVVGLFNPGTFQTQPFNTGELIPVQEQVTTYYGNNHVPPVWIPDEVPEEYNDDEEVITLLALILAEVL